MPATRFQTRFNWMHISLKPDWAQISNDSWETNQPAAKRASLSHISLGYLGCGTLISISTKKLRICCVCVCRTICVYTFTICTRSRAGEEIHKHKWILFKRCAFQFNLRIICAQTAFARGFCGQFRSVLSLLYVGVGELKFYCYRMILVSWTRFKEMLKRYQRDTIPAMKALLQYRQLKPIVFKTHHPLFTHFRTESMLDGCFVEIRWRWSVLQ